jgi:hypothetical protein
VKLVLCTLFFLLNGTAYSAYQIVAPTKAGTGSSIWAQTIANELSKYLDERVIVKHIPGAKGQLGVNEFNNKYKKDPKTMLLSIGSNANKVLLFDLNYDFKSWDPILIQPYNIVTSIWKSYDIKAGVNNIADCGGCLPETLAWAMLAGWDKVNLVKKMPAMQAKAAFLRKELNYIREPSSRHLKDTVKLVNEGKVKRLFHHGLINSKNLKVEADPNWPDTPTFIELYKKVHNTEPSGPLFDAYKLAHLWRDGLQKVIFVHKNNPHFAKISSAFNKMITNRSSIKHLESKLGRYPFVIGKNAKSYLNQIHMQTKKSDLEALVTITKSKVGWKSAKFNPKKAK